MMNVQDLDGFAFDCINHDIGQWREHKFACACPRSGLPWLGEFFNERIRW